MNLDYERDIVPRIADRTLADRVRAHPALSPVIYSGATFQYHPADPTKRAFKLKGITRAIKEYLLVEPAEKAVRPPVDPVRQHIQRDVRAARKRTRGSREQLAAQPLQLRLTGYMRGDLVHRQIADAVLLDKATFARKYPAGIHPWARNLLAAILRRGWYPIAAEFVVFDLTLGCGTPIDLVAVTAAGDIVFIEWKTTSSGDVFMGDAPDAWPMEWHPATGCVGVATPVAKAKVQLALGVMMAVPLLSLPRQRYAAYVIEADDAAIRPIEVERDYLLGPAVRHYQRIAQCRQRPAPAAR